MHADLKPFEGKCILIVEDDPMQAMCFAELLEDAGAQIIGPAATSSAAIGLIARHRLDAALLDANLGGRPVDDVAAALTSQNVPFVFISGHNRSKLPQAFSNVDLLAKPFSAKTLFAAVHKLVAVPLTAPEA